MPSDALSDAVPTPSAAHPAVARGSRPLNLELGSVAGWLQARAMFVIAVSAVLIMTLVGIPRHLGQDGWLALVAGRAVAAHGIPQHDYFAQMTSGAHWVDQQWLAQLVMYEVERLGGLQLLCVLYVLLTGAAFAGAIAAARSLGAEDLHVLVATLPGAFFYLVTAVSIRTQGLVYPLFVATLWLLASEARSPVRRRRVYCVFPILVLWGNLHGSATLGAGLAGLYGVVLLVRNLRDQGLRGLADGRAAAFIVLPPLALLATPYGAAMVHYYRITLLNSQFSRMVTEWKPVSSVSILAVPLLFLIALTGLGVCRQLIRAGRGATSAPPLFDVLALLALAIGAVMAVRNVTWFGLALVVLLPAIRTRMQDGRPAPLRRSRVNLVLAAGCAALAAVMTVAIAGRPSSWFTSTYPAKAIPILKAQLAQDPHAGILADVRYADWLIWEDPQRFSGRVAYDTSFELLRPSQLAAIADLAATSRPTRRLVGSYRIWMLYRGNHGMNRTLLRRPRVRVISRDGTAIIATNGAAAART